ncbi:MAG: hypothetical protein EPO27_06475 [Betaproteobacteria bacterium]|nr:MAG: hypothetical protein EPO27_06475 [Betaproteobacteria bacterium]
MRGEALRTGVAVVLLLFGGACLAELPPDGGSQGTAAYPEAEAAAAWQGLAAGYVRQALKDRTLDKDAALNARIDTVMDAVGAAAAAIDSRFAKSTWSAILIDDFGLGAAAFPGAVILVDAKFVRRLQLNDDELALILSHEAAHVIAGHAAAKLAFMAAFVGKEKLPTARAALVEFFAKDSYVAVFQPEARQQEREADRVGAAIFLATGYDAPRALGLFDKLAKLETPEDGQAADSHDGAQVRKQIIAGVIAELQQHHARRAPLPR